jgi:chitin disaccharide deacetylase
VSRLLTLCADDFGLLPNISAGIARLAHAQRLSAVSCRTSSKHWISTAPWLRELPQHVDLGLHFNLTEGQPLTPRLKEIWPTLPGLAHLTALAHLGRLPRAALLAEFHAQLRAFGETTGRAPDFVDSHQHVHHLPVVRGIVLDAVEHVQPMPALCNTGRVLGPGFAMQRLLIERTGGRALARELALREVTHNPALLGVYDFEETDYRMLMQRWLARVPSAGALLYCHPGETPAFKARDAIAAARRRELDYLGSYAFTKDLRAADVTLGPVWQLESQFSDTSAIGSGPP